ncbi:MAG: FHA domain-containing protein [Planctomycetota bacterium]
MDAAIVFVLQDGKTREVPLKPHTYTIGRHTDCQLRLPESAVSRHHAKLEHEGSRLTVEDLGSSNGTYVNGDKAEGVRELAAGDVVAIGSTVMLVRVDGDPDDFDPAAVWKMGQPEEAIASPPAEASAGANGPKTASFVPDSAGDDSDDGDEPFGGGLLGGVGGDPDGSSFGDFDFDLDDDDEDDQPSL